MKKYSVVLMLAFLLCLGCNQGKVKLGGKVTFDDGSPLTVGSVVFATDSFQSSGDLQPDGSYQMSSFGNNDGLPPGKYKVYVSGASEEVTGKTGTYTKMLIDQKYANFSMTPLECEVPVSGNQFDFSVPKPPK